jgi:uncharacterized protein YggL (DUF469 family)
VRVISRRGLRVGDLFDKATFAEKLKEVMEYHNFQLAFDGSGYLAWEGLICKQEIGQCTEEHQAIVRKWLEDHKCEEVRISELFDVWWD